MSVLSYLEGIGSNLVLSENENSSIKTSISTLQTRLNNHFGSSIQNHFVFGSYTRGTILPRSSDPSSDIDYMVVFVNPNNNKPQTLLDKLKDFVKIKYSTSEVYQEHPTIVLELNHIKFELVPAMVDFLGNYKIPSSDYSDWIYTHPNDFNNALVSLNISNRSEIKPLIRILKLWNCTGTKYMPSFLLEKKVIEMTFSDCKNIKEMLYKFFDNTSTFLIYNNSIINKISRAKEIINETRYNEKNNWNALAEDEIKKLFK